MDRLLLTLATLAFAAAVYALMRKGWLARGSRQSDLPAPEIPDAPLLGDPVPGLFVGTTAADDWLDRIAVHHLSHRGAGSLALAQDGLHVERNGLPGLLLPWGSIEAVTVEKSLAGKVVTSGMLLVTWRLGSRRLASAFRADDRSAHARLRDAVAHQLALRPPLEASS